MAKNCRHEADAAHSADPRRSNYAYQEGMRLPPGDRRTFFLFSAGHFPKTIEGSAGCAAGKEPI